MKLGIDYILLVRYPNVAARHHPRGWAAGVCMKMDNNDLPYAFPAVVKLLKTGKVPQIRISGIWVDGHRFRKRHIKDAVNIAKDVANLATEFPNVRFLYQPWLEPHCSKKLMRRCKKRCRAVLPKRVTIVAGRYMNKGWNEVHHGPPMGGKYIFSFDGDDCRDEDIDRWKRMHASARYFYLWVDACNCLDGEDDTTPRPERTNCLRKRHIDQMVRLGG